MQELRAGEEFFTMGSDRFFAEEAPDLFSVRKIDVALVDGLHEFGQALRDVLNLERFMVPNGLIVLDDCNPPTLERGSDIPNGGEWNGDVWKVAAFLREQRPDLRYVTVNADEGIGLLSSFAQPKAHPDAETVSKYKELNYSYLEQHRAEVLNLVSPGAMNSLWDR
jgi:hypothetical protein